MSEEVLAFKATTGRVTGVLGLVMSVAVGALFVFTERPAVALLGALGSAIVGVLTWAALLRPRVTATSEDLELRTMFEDVTVPLAGIDTVLVRRYLLVRAGGVKYICPAIGRSLRKTVRTEMKWQGNSQILAPGIQPGDKIAAQTEVKSQELEYADFVETEIMRRAGRERMRLGIEERSEEEYELGSQAVRRRAWPEIGALAVLATAFVVTLFFA